MQILEQAVSSGAFLLDLKANSVEQALSRTLDHLVAQGLIPAANQDDVYQGLLHREKLSSTAIGHAVAVPHCYLDCLDKPLVAFVRLDHPLDLGAPDGVPTRYFFVLLGPKEATAEHLETLATVARAMSDDEFRYDLRRARNEADLAESVERFIVRTSPPKHAVHEPEEALEWSGRFLGGIIQDFQRRAPYYVSDFTDGLNFKCLSSVVFLFFACLAPAITFGGILQYETSGQIGVVEMLVATAVCGTAYALFAGQPLIIMGLIGPLLIFTTILYRLCEDMQLPFLPTYACVGLWTSFLLFLLAVTEASVLMRYFTRFTDEIFAALMSLLFIYEAVRALVNTFQTSFAAEENNHDTAFLALILALGTFYLATNLSRLRSSRYLAPWGREFLSDFGPTIALLAMTVLAILLTDRVPLPSLEAPENIGGTTSGRDWLVNPFSGPRWSWVAAFVPALLATLLIFLSHNITGRLINSPDNHLHKGAAYHLDLVVVALLVALSSLFGWPWMVAATVRSLAHVRALAVFEQSVTPNGERHERVLHVQENRLTGLMVHVLIGVSLLALSYLQYVPMAALYGIFLYMGVVSLGGNQFFERLLLFFVDPTLYPRTYYLRQAPVRVIHQFTALQLVCLVVLSLVSFMPVQWLRLLFPLFVALLVPIRMLANRWFEPSHLDALDGRESLVEEDMHWSG